MASLGSLYALFVFDDHGPSCDNGNIVVLARGEDMISQKN
jgi:hypothetical protein